MAPTTINNNGLTIETVQQMQDRQRADAAAMQNAYHNHLAPYSGVGQITGLGGGGAGGYRGALSGYSGVTISDATTTATASAQQMLVQIKELQAQVDRLKSALSHPDRPVNRSLQNFIEEMDMKDVAGRTKPPLDHMTMAAFLGQGYPLDTRRFESRDRSGRTIRARVIGLIVETTDPVMQTSATYLLPTPSLKVDQAFEATADLIAHMVVERVISKMEIDNDSNGPDASRSG